MTEPGFERGDVVRVSEINLHPWEGTVISLKPSPKSGWWADVQRSDSLVWSVTVDLLEKIG